MKQSLLLYSKTHTFETRERKLHVLLIAFGSECSRERKLQGTKVPGSESSRERKFHVTFAPGSESSRERKFQRTKVPGSESTRERKFHLWYFRSWERKYVGTKVPVTGTQHQVDKRTYLLPFSRYWGS